MKRAYAISYAVFRIAGKLQNGSLKDYLEHQALALLNASIGNDREATLQACDKLENLLRFGGDVGLLNEQNVGTVILEIQALKAAMPEVERTTEPSPVPLEDIFAATVQPMVYETAEIKEPAIYISESGNDESGNRESGNAANRQAAILERIRQNGNCRIRDIQELLPGSSERTIRYDLQSLLAQGLIERIGGGGPAVYYRIRQTV